MKVIMVQQYDGTPYPSSLKYEDEIRRFSKFIEAYKLTNPEVTTDEAYLMIKNAFSSINTYSIKEY